MAKILLAEDDNSLREIYGTRLLAEGYDIVSAPDGEAALQMAVKEKPDLILSDVMMPRISGFEMIDILRSQDETKNIKIIVMTALSTDAQREKGESLGVDRYLVKSQVGIEDVVTAVHEVLGDAGATMASTVSDPNESVVPEASAATEGDPTAPAEPSATEPEPPLAETPEPVTQPEQAELADDEPPTLDFDSEILAEAAHEPVPEQSLDVQSEQPTVVEDAAESAEMPEVAPLPTEPIDSPLSE
jgi:CheY-like chemotaxis protein